MIFARPVLAEPSMSNLELRDRSDPVSTWRSLDYSVGHRPAGRDYNQLTGVLEAEAASEPEAALVPALDNRAQRGAWVAHVEVFKDGIAEHSPVPASV